MEFKIIWKWKYHLSSSLGNVIFLMKNVVETWNLKLFENEIIIFQIV